MVHRPAAAARRADLVFLVAALAFIGVAFAVGTVLNDRGVPLHAHAAPLLAHWRPRVGPTTPAASAIAVVVVGWGPAVADRLGWYRLLLASYAISGSWVLALGLVDGWSRLVEPLTENSTYLAEVDTAPPLLELLRTFSGRIVHGESPDPWATHVAGHPPGALEFFVLLDRLGLGGAGWAGTVCVLTGSSACVAVAVALRSVAGERMARQAVPYLVLVPAAIWIGVSADAFFLAVSAWGVALLAVATRTSGARSDLAACGSGLLLGCTLYLSYGLVLIAAVAGAVLLAGRRVRPGIVALAVVAAVVVAVTTAGFWWWEGYQQLAIRYYQGWGGERPYAYWVWADLAALLLCTGPAVAVGLRRIGGQCVTAVRSRVLPHGWGVGAVVLGAAVAILAATLSGFSKAEVARIWLPFALWLVAACALLPRPRRWLAVQAVTALLLQHLLLVNW
ncbi:MAG: hypothetical protein ACRDMV_20620 [Streptosporangiales bacterium]